MALQFESIESLGAEEMMVEAGIDSHLSHLF